MQRITIATLAICLVMAGGLTATPSDAKGKSQDLRPPQPNVEKAGGKARISSSSMCNLEGFDEATFQCTSSITGSATLVRSRGGITANIDSSGLDHHETVTFWFFIIEPDGTELLVYGGGHVIGKSGQANFAGHLTTGREVSDFLGNPVALSDPFNSLVLLILRSHGPAVPGYVSDQISSMNGGCLPGEPNEGLCVDKQIAVLFP